MDSNFEIINRKIIRVGNSYAVALAPTKAAKFGFDLGTRVQVGIRDGLLIITREGDNMFDMSELSIKSANSERHVPLKANEQNFRGLSDLSSELGEKSLAWINQRTYGYNANLRLGEKRRRVIIRKGQVVVFNLDLMTILRFPESINVDNFPALKGLRMNNCKVQENDLSSIEAMQSLQKLILSDNEIDEIDLSALSNLKRLHTLFINNNLLDKIDLEPLKGLKNVEALTLSGNELESVDLSPLKEMNSLKELHLDDNFLTEIDLNPLQNLDELFLSLENNPLVNIDLGPLSNIENLRIILPENLSTRTQEQIQVLQEKGADLSVMPSEKLTTGEIFGLPPELQETALTILSLARGTAEEIAIETGISLDEAQKNINSLQKRGYIGRILKNGKAVYFKSD
jgi:hypothetical protein